MKINAAPRILVVAALCAAALIGFVINEGLARANGQEIMLPIEAVDPRALLSGHYVQLGFTQTLDAGAPCPANGEGWDWLALKPQGGRYVLAGGAPSHDQAEQVGPLLIKGTFTCAMPGPPQPNGQPGAPAVARLNIGIERFYVDQTDARRIEAVLREQKTGETRALAIVSVGRDGQARLKGLAIDGRRLELNWL